MLKKDKVLDTRFSLNSVESDSFLEVSFEGTTKEELNDLFTKLKGRYLLGYLLKSFSEGYKPVLEAGEILPFGSCDHHSGYIEGRLIVLPTGRFAVISRYSGERRIGEYNIWWGILDDPYAVPDWSAKSESWDGEDLKEPTQEEIEFMKSIDTEYRQKTGKKYISFEELEAHKPELPE